MLLLPLHEHHHRFKYEALYHALRSAIRSGQFTQGYRLPASREMAKAYGLSRGTVDQVYDMLCADGYIERMVGRGTFVSYALTMHQPGLQHSMNQYHLSEWYNRLPAGGSIAVEPDVVTYDLSINAPALEQFPLERWKKAIRRGLEALEHLTRPVELPVQGLKALREAIAVYLNHSRGMSVEPDNVCITNGSFQGAAILANMFISPGDEVLVEEPTYSRIRNAVTLVGGVPVPIPLKDGRQDVESAAGKSRLAFVTPSHQYPIGRFMDFTERRSLLEWAKQNEAVIVEDDIDSEFRWKGRPIEPLKVLDSDDRVVYLGTFYNTLLPTLRIGYAVLPPWLTSAFARAKEAYEPYLTAPVEQMAIAEFMKSGDFERNLKKMRNIYGEKYRLFRSLLANQVPNGFTWADKETGLDLFGWWNHSENEFIAFRNACRVHGVDWSDPSIYFMNSARAAVVWEFTHLTLGQIREVVHRIAQAYHEVRPSSR